MRQTISTVVPRGGGPAGSPRRALARLAAAALLIATSALGWSSVSARPAGQASLSLSLDRGEGATYTIGDPIEITYRVDPPSWLRFTVETRDGARVLVEGYESAGGGVLRLRVGEPPGQHNVYLDAFSSPDGGDSLIASTQTWFLVQPSAGAAPAEPGAGTGSGAPGGTPGQSAGSGAGSGPPAARPTPVPQRIVVSGADNGRAIAVPVGSTIQVALLDSGWRWSPFSFDGYILQLESAPGLFPATFRAQHAGLTTISSLGTATCRDASPPCMSPDLDFRLSITVQD